MGTVGSNIVGSNVVLASGQPFCSPVAAELIDQLTAAAGTAPTALWVPGEQTWETSGLDDPAEVADHIYQIDDLTGNAYHLREISSAKGPILRSGQCGTGLSMEFLRTNAEALDCLLSFDGAATDMHAVRASTLAAVVNLPDNNVDDSTISRNPGIFGQTNSAGGRPLLVWRDDPTSHLIGAHAASGAAASINTTSAPYDTDLVVAIRNGTGGYRVSADKTHTPDTGTAGDMVLSRTLTLGRVLNDISSFIYLSGDIGIMAAWNVMLTNGQLDDVVDVIRAAQGCSAV